jgi:hypothetical protein
LETGFASWETRQVLDSRRKLRRVGMMSGRKDYMSADPH